MKKLLKSTLAVLLCTVLMLGTVAMGGSGIASKAEATSYAAGDTLYYGTYPQSKVTDTDLLSALESQSKSWVSYGYYSGTGTFANGKMVPSDYMRYADISYDGNKYRAVVFDSYRPDRTGLTNLDDNSEQDDNGYLTDTTYYFKFEPLKWCVLDTTTGLVLSESIIDSQAYNNYLLWNDLDNDKTGSWDKDEHFGDSAQTHYASDYANSSLRQWLNNDFYNTAFGSTEKSNIATTTLNNDGIFTLTGNTYNQKLDSASTSDKIFLLSYTEAKTLFTDDDSRLAYGTDYAKCQGLYTYGNNGTCNTSWRFRSPGDSSYNACGIYPDGVVGGNFDVTDTYKGIRVALKMQNLKSDSSGSELNIFNVAVINATGGSVDYRTKTTFTATATGVPEGYYLAIYDGTTQLAKGTNTSVTYNLGELKSSKNLTVKVVDASGNVQKDSSGNELSKDVTITVNSGFWQKIVAFFKSLSGSLPTKEIKP